MKRIVSIVFVLILLVSGLFILTGCNKEKEPGISEQANIEMQTFEYLDENSGNKITFEYLPEENYEITDTDDGGKYKRIDFENKELNLAISMYFVSSDFEHNRENNKEADNYREYTANGHEGFTYTESNGLTLQNNILVLPQPEEDFDLTLYMYVEKLDSSQDTNLVETFYGEEFQRFLNTLKYEKVN